MILVDTNIPLRIVQLAHTHRQTALEAIAEVPFARGLFEMLVENGQVYSIWEGLISKYAVQGKTAHDTRLVAMMIEHRVRKLLTFNDADFSRYQEIQAVNPFDVLGLARI